MKTKMIQPLLRWAGAKRWFAPQAIPTFTEYLTETGGRYFEPFFGSGSMGIQMPDTIERVFADRLEPLIEFHEMVRDKPGELAWGLSALAIKGVDKENFLWVRDEHKPDTPVGRAARFFYLNRICFNGLYRENKKGKFNVPYGDAAYRKSVIGRSARDAIESLFPNREKIQNVHHALQGALIGAADFEEVIAEAGDGDLVYCDPPYHDTFSGYERTGFNSDDHERLATALYEATGRGAAVIAHNSLTDKVRYWYGEWCEIVEVKEKRSIAARGSSRKKAPCAVISNRKIP